MEPFGSYWSGWIRGQAEAKSCSPDYVAAGLLAGAGVLIGNARWGSPWEGWAEPPIVWIAAVGNPSSGKSPGLDAVRGELSMIELDANAGREDELREWDTAFRAAKLHLELWEGEHKVAIKKGATPPPRPGDVDPPEKPARRRIITNDPTVEKVARIMVENPKGLLVFRDELAGWVGGLDRYGGAGGDRAFYLENYGGRPYPVDRVKATEPIVIPALTLSLAGGIQPDRLNSLVLSGDDDGLAARFLYLWPERVPPRRPTRPPPSGTKSKLDKLYSLQIEAEDNRPTLIPFADAAAAVFQTYREQVAEAETGNSGLFLSWLGKLPGFAVRLATILEHLVWCGDREWQAAPQEFSEQAAFEERAVTIEYDAGVPRAWHEGFARLCTMSRPEDVPPRRWEQFLDDSGRFLDGQWAECAAELGWGPLDLFGCERQAPFARVDLLGLLWLLSGRRLVAITAATAVMEGESGARLTYRRKPAEADSVLAWELRV